MNVVVHFPNMMDVHQLPQLDYGGGVTSTHPEISSVRPTYLFRSSLLAQLSRLIFVDVAGVISGREGGVPNRR